MQSDLRNFGSLTFFEQNIDDIPEVPEPIYSIEVPKALAEAEHMLDTGSPEFNEKTETILSVLYASDTVPIRRCSLHGDKHYELSNGRFEPNLGSINCKRIRFFSNVGLYPTACPI
jgi:hypothetical protein